MEEIDSILEDLEATTDSISIKEHTRTKRGRKPLPENLPRVEVIHDLIESEKVCPHDGEKLKEIGRETSEQLEFIPAKIRVIKHIRLKYACPCCQQGVKTAPLPPQPIPKSMASPGLLAQVVTAKFEDSLPLYRQEKQFKRLQIQLPRNTLANWVIKVSELVQPLINLMQDKLLASPYLLMDETTVQVLKEPNKAAKTKSYMWVRYAAPPDQPVILFNYESGRSAQVPIRQLEGYRGYLHTDGYEGYAAIGKSKEITHLGCWAHARRKFNDAIKAQANKNQKKKIKGNKATKGLNYIGKL